jgi:tetratricopeptide (TPR) repeat protein
MDLNDRARHDCTLFSIPGFFVWIASVLTAPKRAGANTAADLTRSGGDPARFRAVEPWPQVKKCNAGVKLVPYNAEIRNAHLARRLTFALEQLESAKDKPWLDNKLLHDFLKSCGHQARRLDRRDLGYLFFDLARRISPKDTFCAIDAAIELRDSGKVRPALQRLDKLLETDPSNPFALHEKGVCFYVSGNVVEAKDHFRKTVELNPGHQYAWMNLLKSTIALQQYDESAALLDRLREIPNINGQWLDMLHQLIVFLNDHGPEISKIACRNDQTITKSDNFEELSANIAERIRAAIAAREPFALVRLGDGEGSLLATSIFADVPHYDQLLINNRTDFLVRWFGLNAGHAAKCIEALTGDLRRAINEADLVGIPDGQWWQRELRLASMRGLPSLGAVLLHTKSLDEDRLCHHQINQALNRYGGLETILSDDKRPVVIIGPHPGIETYVRKKFLVQNVNSIRVPARQADLAALPYRRDQRCHYPVVYTEVCRAIEDLPEPSICLVGAGSLGKIYCAKAKANGHVAIDLGSVFDSWIGVSTRFYV